MPRSTRMPISGSVMMLPDELLIECLTRLPGKQLARCKCVCKSWQSVIGSPPFQEVYRSRQRGLLLYFPEPVDKVGKSVRFRFFYSPLQRLKEQTEEFACVYELGMDSILQGMTQMVNGLICVSESVCETDSRDPNISLTIYNICTGQRMRVLPDPTPYFNTRSTFHLGYDPARRTYKLLRLIFHLSNHSSAVISRPMRAHIMTLRPSGSLSTWRKLKPTAAGIYALRLPSTSMYYRLSETRTFPGDGVLCWIMDPPRDLICFDFNKEKFRRVKFPENVERDRKILRVGAQGRPALWVLPRAERGFVIHTLEDDEGNRWSKHCVQYLKEHEGFDHLVVANSNLPGGEMLLMMNPRLKNQYMCSSSGAWPVYTYDHQTNKIDRFFVGKLPENPIYWFDETHRYTSGSISSMISCLDSNNLYLSLDELLSGRVELR